VFDVSILTGNILISALRKQHSNFRGKIPWQNGSHVKQFAKLWPQLLAEIILVIF
jgi:hypothetical protein